MGYFQLVSGAEPERQPGGEHQVTPLELVFDLAYRTTGRIFRRRTVGAIVLLALVPVAVAIPALAALALVSAVCSLIVAYEVLRYREQRIQVRHPELAA